MPRDPEQDRTTEPPPARSLWSDLPFKPAASETHHATIETSLPGLAFGDSPTDPYARGEVALDDTQIPSSPRLTVRDWSDAAKVLIIGLTFCLGVACGYFLKAIE